MASQPSAAAATRAPLGSEPAVDRDRIVDRLAPLSVQWRRSDGERSASVLFDGDQATGLRADGEALVRVTLADARPLRGVGVFGQADGKLSVFTAGASGQPDRAVAGLQDLDLAALPLRWNRFWVEAAGASASAARQLVLRWRPARAGAVLRELELFGLVPDASPTAGAVLADRLLAGAAPAGSVEAWSELEAANVSSPDLGLEAQATFPVRLPIDPRLIDRAFLVYELGGLERWSAPLRQINGFSLQGKHKAERVPGGAGVQVEEISPEWLFHGDNEIHFRPVDERDPVGYRVRRVRLVAFPGGGRPSLSPPPAAASGAAGTRGDDTALVGDGDPATGVHAGASSRVLTFALPAAAQPTGLNVRVADRLSGSLRIATVGAGGALSAARTVDASTLAPGWTFLPLDGLPPGSAVRLTWDAGKEGGGLLSEVRVATSPAPEGRGRQLVLSAPLHGECVDHEVYLRGFVTGVTADSDRPKLSVAGRPAAGGGAIAADGAFALALPEPADARNRRWSVPLRARFADGEELARDIAIEACGDRPLARRPPATPGPRPLIDDEGAPFGKTVAAGQAATVSMGGVRLEIPAGALERTTRITVRPLADDQIAPLEPMMDNVTPDRQAFRLGPHNLRFAKPVRIAVPYDRGLVAEGIAPEEIGVFYFDDQLGSWQSVPLVARRNGRELVAETTHFTDFIAATLSKPESPSRARNTGNMIADIKAGDPAAKIRMIEPPTAQPDGTVRMKFPIDIPPGRDGLQPDVDLEYNSAAGDGLMGVGWSFPQPNIQIDTKFGTPRVITDQESDRYLLNGEELVKLGGGCGTPPARCSAGAQFRRRVEKGRFEKIFREGPFGTGGWTVKDQDGRVSAYGTSSLRGGASADILEHTNEAGVPFYWALASITDKHGNRVKYDYTHVFDASSSRSEIRVASINYTQLGSGSTLGAFTIVPYYNDRASTLINARLGKQVNTTKLMTGLTVFFRQNNAMQTYRRYFFGYEPGEFGRPLLKTISVHSGNSETLFYTYKFDYNQIPKVNGKVTFGDPIQWGSVATSLPLGRGGGDSTGKSGFVGVGPPICFPHAGAGMSGGSSSESSHARLIDINGDGLPDLINGKPEMGESAVYLNGFDRSGGQVNRDRGSFTATSTGGFGNISNVNSSSRTLGLGLHFPGEIGANGSYTTSHATETLTLADMNGDGLPDLFNGLKYYCNQYPGSTCAKNATLPFDPVGTDWAGSSTPVMVFTEAGPGTRDNTSYQTRMVARWTAPYVGRVRVTAPARRVSTIQTGVPNQPATDDARVEVYRRYATGGTGVAESMYWSFLFAATDNRTCHPGLGSGCNASSASNVFSVVPGDEFYFMVSAPVSDEAAGNRRSAVEWDPVIDYLDLSCPNPSDARTCMSLWNDHHGSRMFQYSLRQDHGIHGGLPQPWITASADTRPGGSTPTPTVVRVTGIINKLQNTTDDVKFQIVKLRPSAAPEVVWTQTMTADQTGSISLDAANIYTNVIGKWVNRSDSGSGTSGWTVEGDKLVFQVVTDSPIHPATLNWRPIVTYQNYCYPDPKDIQNRFLSSTPRVMPSPEVVNILCTNDPASIIGAGASQVAEVQYPAFRFQPQRPGIVGGPPVSGQAQPPRYYFSDLLPHTIRLSAGVSITPGPRGVDPNSNDLGQVVLLAQAAGPGGTARLMWKQVVKLGTDPSTRTFTLSTPNMPINGSDALYFTVISYGNHTISMSNPQAQLDAQPTPLSFSPFIRYLAEPPLPGQAAGAPYAGETTDKMVGGFHGWTYGAFNASDYSNFSTSLIALSYDPIGVGPFFPPASASNGLGLLPSADLPGALGPVWRGRTSDDYIAPGVFHASYTGSGAAEASFPPGTGLRRTSGTTVGIGGGAVVSVEKNGGHYGGEIDLRDATGDGIPDLVTLDHTQAARPFLDGAPGFTVATSRPGPLPFGSLRHTETYNTRWGIGLGSKASQMIDKPEAGGGTKSMVSTEPSFGLAYGSSTTDVDLIDINGDGVLDFVKKNRGTSDLLVRLGLGLGAPALFYRQYQSLDLKFVMAPLSGDVWQVTDYLPGPSDLLDGLNVQDNLSNSLEINILGMGGGVSYTGSRTMVQMIDLNGDGLPDRVQKRPSDDDLRVQFNLGSSFTTAQSWAMPRWSTFGVPIESGNLPVNILGSNDALGFTQSLNHSVSVGFPFYVPLLFVCLVGEVAGKIDTTANNTQMTLEDINGDGYPDQVFKQNDLTIGGESRSTVWVKLNPSGKADLLKTVTNPLGGRIEIDYERAGNEIDPATHTDDPANHWVMKEVALHRQPAPAGAPIWNADPPQRSTFKYANGFYSRADRMFLGFSKVTTTQTGTADQLVVQDTYDTSDVYHRGLLKTRVKRRRPMGDTTADDGLPLYEMEERQYEVRPLQGPTSSDSRPINFVPERKRFLRTYESTTTLPTDPSLVREEGRDYENTYGNVKLFEDKGDTQTTADNVSYTITYVENANEYVVQPQTIVAKDSANVVLAERRATYFANTAKVETITEIVRGGRKPADGTTYNGVSSTWQFTYDGYGRPVNYIDPSGYTVTVTAYDPTAGIYPTDFQDGMGYTWKRVHNILTGDLTWTKDVAGVSVYRTYDVHERLSRVYTPNFDQANIRLQVTYAAAADPAIDGTRPARALVEHMNPERSLTLSMADGWGRIIQTHTKAEVEDGAGNLVAGAVMSGRSILDAAGRVTTAGMPRFVAAAPVDLTQSAFDSTAARDPQTFSYDVLSRRTRVAYPGTRPPTVTTFDLPTVASVRRRRQVLTDSNGRVRRAYADARGNVVRQEIPNTIGGTMVDVTTKYEYDPLDRIRKVIDHKNNNTIINWDSRGLMVDVTNADTGKTFYDYELDGKLGKRQNANGKTIRYAYSQNRLDRVTYTNSTATVYTYGAPGATNGRAGRVHTRTDETGVETFSYDIMGNVSQVQYVPAVTSGTPPTYTTTYGHDLATGTLRSVLVGGQPEIVVYGYNSQGLVSMVAGGSGSAGTFYAQKIGYNEFGQRTLMVHGPTTRYTYHPFTRRLTNLDTNDAVENPVQRLVYGYDQVGNVTGLANNVPAPTSGTPSVSPARTAYTFGYDNAYQLRTATGSYTGVGSLGGRGYTLSMSYDEIGNITNKNQADVNRPTAGAPPQTVAGTSYNVNYTYAGPRPHAATTIGGETATYDSDGNRLSQKVGSTGRDLTWNEEDRMRTVRVNGGSTTTFFYRPDGERAIKRAATDTYYVSPHFVDRRGVSTTRHIMLGNERIASVVTPQGGTARLFAYQGDHLQSTNYVFGGNGTLYQGNEYFPFGETWVENVLSPASSNKTPYLFSGKEQDESGLYYFGGRYQDPRTSTWMSPDPALAAYAHGAMNAGVLNPANLHLYSYTYNNPVTLRDPTGLQAQPGDPPNAEYLPEMRIVIKSGATNLAETVEGAADVYDTAGDIASVPVDIATINNFRSAQNTIRQVDKFLANADLLPQGVDFIRFNTKRFNEITDLVETADPYSSVGKVSKLSKGLGVAGVGLSVVKLGSGIRTGDKGTIIEGAGDVASGAVGFLGPIGGAWAAGWGAGGLISDALERWPAGNEAHIAVGGAIARTLGIAP